MYNFKIFYDTFFWDMVLHHWIVGTHVSRQYGGLIKVKIFFMGHFDPWR